MITITVFIFINRRSAALSRPGVQGHANPLRCSRRRPAAGSGPAGERVLVLARRVRTDGRHIKRHHHGHRRRERIRQRDPAGRRQVRQRHGDREQPEHRPAHLRGESGRRAGDQQRRARRAERSRLRHLGDHDRERRPSSGRKVINVQQLLGLPDSTPNPHLWYKPNHDAGRGQRDRRRPRRDPARARGLLQGQRGHVHRQPDRLDHAIATFKAAYPAPRWRRPSRWPTTCCRPSAPTT